MISILGRGFIGGFLAQRLAQEGYVVDVLSREECDLTSWDQVSRTKTNDILLLTATISRLRDNTRSAYCQNLSIADNVGRLIEERRPYQCIFLSSVDVYGAIAANTLIKESLPFAATDSYGLAKIASEQRLAEACRRSGTILTILRLPGIYGPGDAGKSTINRLVSSAINEGIITIHGDGSTLRDFVAVEDLYRLLVLLIKRPVAETFNVAKGISDSIATVAKIIVETIPNNVELIYQQQAERAYDMRFDISKLRSFFPAMQFTSVGVAIQKYCCHQNPY